MYIVHTFEQETASADAMPPVDHLKKNIYRLTDIPLRL